MTRAPLDPIVLGHNAFFGVDHLSKQRGATREATFARTEAIVEVIRFAATHGVRAMMMSTHPRSIPLTEAMRRDAGLSRELTLYPLLPYVAKYVRQANEKGLVQVVLDQLKGAGWGRRLALLGSGGLGVLTKDYREILKTLIRMELMPFERLQVGAVFLHDALTDLALALDLPEVFALYQAEIAERYGATPAFATKNLPLLVERFRAHGLPPPLALTHVNKTGFGMNPTREACERCLASGDVRIMAMGTLASGYLRPDEAYEYVFRQAGVASVVVGVSSPAHAEETFAAIRRHSAAKAG